MLLGVALVALATIFRASAAVAGPFATLGPLCVVLGVLVHRAEGLVKLGPSGLEMTLRELGKRARKDKALREPQKADVLAAAAGRIYELPPVVSTGQARRIASDLYLRSRNEYMLFEERVREWLQRQGWKVAGAGEPAQVDFVAVRDHQRAYVEAKYTTRPLQRGQLLDGLARVLNAVARDPGSRGILFVHAPSLTQAARSVAETAPIEIYVSTSDDDFKRLSPAGDAPTGDRARDVHRD
jgi:Restriction endonuclease